MSDGLEAALSAAPCNPLLEQRAARLTKFERERLIVEYLNRGVSIAEIAARIGVGEKRMRAVIREILARRMPAPPEEFVAIQVSRLNEALLVAYSAMTGMNLKAVDRVVKIVRELDRYHGFVAAERRLPERSSRITVRGLDAPAEATMAFGAALVCRPEFAPQPPVKIGFAPGFALVPEVANPVEAAQEEPAFAPIRESEQRPPALDAMLDSRSNFQAAPQDLVPSLSKHVPASSDVAAPWIMLRDATLRVAPRHEDLSATLPLDDGPGNLAQHLGKIESAPGLAMGAETPGGADASRGQGSAIARGEPGQDFHTLDTHNDRPENPQQGLENVESAPGNDGPAKASASAGASGVSPTFPGPIRAGPLHVRATLNGVAAC
jgi:transposase-like protein